MANKPLDNDFLKTLLATPERKSGKSDVKTTPYPFHPQNGPLRHVDTQKHCASRGCTTQTWFTVDGIPYCTMHSLTEMNKLCIKAGISAKQCPGCGLFWNSTYTAQDAYDDITFDKDCMAYVCRACDEIIVQGPREL